jgi:flagellar biosynthesis/type III secretory pathway protein FliH
MGIEEFLLQRERKKGWEEGRQEGRQEGKQEGFEEGIEEGIGIGMEKSKIAFTKSLLATTDFNDEKIASIVDVTVDFVRKVKVMLE